MHVQTNKQGRGKTQLRRGHCTQTTQNSGKTWRLKKTLSDFICGTSSLFFFPLVLLSHGEDASPALPTTTVTSCPARRARPATGNARRRCAAALAPGRPATPATPAMSRRGSLCAGFEGRRCRRRSAAAPAASR